MNYCPYCGTRLTPGEDCTCEGALEAKREKAVSFKSIKKLMIPAFAALVVLAGALLIGSNISSTIDLEDYIVINGVSGLNGKGTISYSLDEEALYAVYIGERETEDYENLSDDEWNAIMTEGLLELEEFEHAMDCITLTATTEEGLSNGDELTVTATFDNVAGYELSHKFNEGSLPYIVSGLVDAVPFDPFAPGVFEIIFTGASGSATAKIDVVAEEDVYKYVTYTLSDIFDLSNGDQLSVNVFYDDSTLEYFGYLPPEKTEYVFTVSGLPESIEEVVSSEESPKEAFPNGIDQSLKEPFVSHALNQARKEVAAYASEGYDQTIVAPEAVSFFFMKTYSNEVPHVEKFKNQEFYDGVGVLIHYDIMFTTETEDHHINYWTLHVYPGCYCESDGTLSFDDSDYFTLPYDVDNKDIFIEKILENFSDMAIKEYQV